MSSYVPITDAERKKMLETIGAKTFDDLLQGIPKELRQEKLNLPKGLSEIELRHLLRDLAGKNETSQTYLSFLGGGAYDHFIPAAVSHLISRSEFYTAYTPYQPEASQGTLQVLFEYQSMICELTGMDVSNASLYEGASATAEAALVARIATRREEVVVAKSVHPEYRQVMKTYLLGVAPVHEISFSKENGTVDVEQLRHVVNDKTACVIVQNPNFFGCIEDLEKVAAIAHEKGALLIACVNPIALAVLKSPGECGADIAVGEGQPLGNMLYAGGPYFGFFAVKEPLMRKIPGRIVGETLDRNGKRAFVLTLQAREQHIRREKASSNICTNQTLNAIAGCIYLTLLGPRGLQEVAHLALQKSHYAQQQLCKTGMFKPLFKQGHFFNEFALQSELNIDALYEELQKKKILPGLRLKRWHPSLANALLVCVTETKERHQIDQFVEAVEKIAHVSKTSV